MRSRLEGRARCHYHGGKTPRGIASPHFRTGRYSKYLPGGLEKLCENARADPGSAPGRAHSCARAGCPGPRSARARGWAAAVARRRRRSSPAPGRRRGPSPHPCPRVVMLASKVTLCQRLCGTRPMARSPRGARARSRVKVVGVAVSSRKTKRCGATAASAPATPAASPRRARWRSGTFFERQPEPRQRPRHGGRADGHALGGRPVGTVLGQRGVGVRPHLLAQRRFGRAPMRRGRPGAASGPRVPVSRRRCCQRRIVRSVTPKVRAASARASPASRARSKRSRKSAGYCFIRAGSHPGRLLCNSL